MYVWSPYALVTAYDRRTFVKTAGAGILSVGVAGCSGSSDSGSDSEGMSEDVETLDEEPDYGDWFSDVPNYQGATVDKTGADEVTIQVGADDGLVFSPAAVAVSSGTDVVFEWTGQGGSHNVKADDESFDSGLESEQGFTFTETFDEQGIYKYICSPHLSLGMKGAVTVVSSE
jgi:halocyanin domain